MKLPPYYPYPDSDPLWSSLPAIAWASADEMREIFTENSHAACPEIAGSHLDKFLQSVLADEELLRGYFYMHTVLVGSDREGYEQVSFYPVSMAVRAAVRASESPFVLPHEKDLAYLATLLYPCGLYHLIHPVFGPRTKTVPTLTNAKKQTATLLEDALRGLRKNYPAMGQTMAAVLGAREAENLNESQVKRLQSAVVQAASGAMALGLETVGGEE